MASRPFEIGAISAAIGVGLLILGSLGFLLPHADFAYLTSTHLGIDIDYFVYYVLKFRHQRSRS